MIATKIILTDPTVTFQDALEAMIFFFKRTAETDAQLLPHTVETLDNNWIANSQNFTFEHSNSVGIVNYSVDQEHATLFAESLDVWNHIIPETSTVRFEQYTVNEIPASATPILVDGNFYFGPDNILDGSEHIQTI